MSNLVDIYKRMLKESADEEVDEKCAKNEEEEEQVDEANVADPAIVSKVQKILSKADKRTLMVIKQWIDKESDKVKI